LVRVSQSSDCRSFAAHPDSQFVAGETEIAEERFPVRELSLEQRLQPAIVLHAISEGVADERDVVVGLRTSGSAASQLRFAKASR